MTLQEMEAKLRDLMRLHEDGAIDDDTYHDTFESIIDGEISDKLEAYASVLDNMQDSVVAIDNRIKKLKDRKASLEREEEWLKENIMKMMTTAEIKSLKTPFHTFSKRIGTSRQVVVDVDERDLPEWALRTKVEINKTAISDYIKENGSCDFAHLAEAKEVLTIK